MYRILIVEDELQISRIVKKYLEKSGYECIAAANGFEALEYFSADHFHLVILDVMMPGIDGFEVLERIRTISDLPVLMLTAKNEEIDRLKGFEHGADDYVTKPFSPRELVERVKVFLKRVYQASDEAVLVSGELQLYTSSMKLKKGESEIEITAAEFKLLHAMMKSQNQILTREQLIELAFGMDYEGYDRNVDSYIKRIRQKIETDPRNPEYLHTKYGLGYMFGGEKS
ncbi:MAG: response regulator transcription factor [Lachnospiraceae bacterium]